TTRETPTDLPHDPLLPRPLHEREGGTRRTGAHGAVPARPSEPHAGRETASGEPVGPSGTALPRRTAIRTLRERVGDAGEGVETGFSRPEFQGIVTRGEPGRTCAGRGAGLSGEAPAGPGPLLAENDTR